MVGQRFGKWVVESTVDSKRVVVLCDCGKRRVVRLNSIKCGQSKSCGCGRKRAQTAQVGDRFHRLVVRELLGSDRHRRRLALMTCDCGRDKILSLSVVQSGETKSCGCLRDSQIRKIAVKHGGYATDLYRRWQSMWERTRRREVHLTYARQSIKVHSGWGDFSTFRDYIEKNLGPRPKGFTLDRIDNTKDYAPGNIRWASSKEQARNRSNNRVLTYQNETKCAAEWAEQLGISVSLIYQRLNKGWSDERVLQTPRNKYTRHD